MSGFLFISYCRRDAELLDSLKVTLEAKALRTWHDAELQAGAQFVDALFQKITESTLVIAIWSKNASTSSFMFKEMFYAEQLGKLIPIAVGGQEPHPYFASIHHLSLPTFGSKRFRQMLLPVSDSICARLRDTPKVSEQKLSAREARVSDKSVPRVETLGLFASKIVERINRVAPIEGYGTLLTVIQSGIIDNRLVQEIELTLVEQNVARARLSILIDWKRYHILFEHKVGDVSSGFSDVTGGLDILLRRVETFVTQMKKTTSLAAIRFRGDAHLEAAVGQLRSSIGIKPVNMTDDPFLRPVLVTKSLSEMNIAVDWRDALPEELPLVQRSQDTGWKSRSRLFLLCAATAISLLILTTYLLK